MAEAARRYHQEDEVAAALRAFGLPSRDVITRALFFAEAERRTCTKNDPGILTGMVGWGRGIRSLREQLRPEGWQRKEPKSLPLVVSRDGGIAITIAAGDDQAGNPHSLFATTKYKKGPMLCDWANGYYQPPLSGLDTDEPEERPDLWILLVQRTKTQILAELSRPTSATREDHLRFGGDRIFLAPILIDQTLPQVDEDGEENEAVDEVHVERL